MKKTIEQQLLEAVELLREATGGLTTVRASLDVSHIHGGGSSALFVVSLGDYAWDSKWPFKAFCRPDLNSAIAEARAHIADRQDAQKVSVAKVAEEAAKLGYTLTKKEAA